MSYIKESKEKPFTLWDFYNNTKFIVRSRNNSYCACHILLVNSHCNDNGCTEVEVIVWVSDKGYGRYTISIEEVTSKIDMKQLLIEIAKTFGKTDIDEKYCYIEVESEKMDFTF
jgi:hypothetical protein